MDVVLNGRYKLISTLGKGGMGEVWRGLDTMLNRPVAVKLIRLSAAPSADDYEDAARRFRREAQAVAALNHPNIVAAYDFGIDADTPYLVMEMIEGRSLTAELHDRARGGDGPLPIGRVLAIATDVCAGLSAAHAAGVIHRDLKPANLMTVTRTGRVKIVDFGTARGGSLSRVTQTGSIVGTVAYIAPEMLTSSDIDGRADLYALGCVLYELLAGRGAYDASDPAQFIAAHLHLSPTPLRELRPDAPEALETLLLDMLAKEPEHRPADADEVATRLAAALPHIQASTERPGRAASVPAPRDPAVTRVETTDDLVAAPAGVSSGPVAGAAELPDPVPAGPTVALRNQGTVAPPIPAQRSPRPPADPGLPPLSDERRSRGRMLVIAGIVVALVVAGTVWAATRGNGRPTTSTTADTPASQGPSTGPAASHGPSTGPAATPAPTAASGTPDAPPLLASVRTMDSSPACGAPSQLSFNASGSQLAGAGRSSGHAGSGIACVWTVSTGKITYQATGYHRIIGAQFDRANSYLTYITSQGSPPIQIGKVGATGGAIKDSLSNSTHLRSNLEAVAVADDGRTLAVSYTDSGTVQFYNLDGHRWTANADSGVAGKTGTLAFSPDGSRIVHAEPAGVEVLASAQSSQPHRTWHGPGANAAAFLTDGKILTCTKDRISLYDVTSTATTPERTTTIGGRCVGIAVRPGTHDIAVSTTDHGVMLLTLPSGWA